METLLLLCVAVITLVQPSHSFCPHECVCDDYSLEASCIKSNLEVIVSTIYCKPNPAQACIKIFNFFFINAQIKVL